MNCKYHTHTEALSLCEICKNPICTECTHRVNDKTICHECIKQALFTQSPTELKPAFIEKFLFFCLSLIPGAAHMQLGLFRRGLQLMFLALGVIIIPDYIGLNFFIPLILIPVWFFSFFESNSLRKQISKGLPIHDKDLFNHQLFDYTPILKNRRIIGGIITIFGFLSLMHVMERYSAFDLLFQNWNYYYMIKSSLIPSSLILAGIYLIIIAKPKQKVLDRESTSDIE
jgi:hypothetical protein